MHQNPSVRIWHDQLVLSFLSIVVGLVADLIAWMGLAREQARRLDADRRHKSLIDRLPCARNLVTIGRRFTRS